MDELEARWREVFHRYPELKSEREAQVARWEWASGQRYDLRPYFFERHNVARGRRLAAEPPDRNGSYLYGFDVQDRLVLARRFTVGMDYSQSPLMIALRGMKAVPQWSDQFLTHLEGHVEAVTYTQFEPRMPVGVCRLSVKDGKPVSYQSLEMAIGPQVKVHTAEAVWDLIARTVGVLRQHEKYTYDGDHLVGADVRLDSARGMSNSHEDRMSYEAGRLVGVTRIHPDGTTQTAYQRAKKGETLPVLAKRVEARLLQAIPESLAGARVRDRVYCLVLIYHDRYAPPDLVLGLERDRNRLMGKRSDEARYFIYVPAKPWVQIQDSAFEAEYALFEQLVTSNEAWTLARDMLRRVASSLAQRDWAGIMEVTPDFVAYAADYEADDIAQAIAASNEQSRVAQLRASGWL